MQFRWTAATITLLLSLYSSTPTFAACGDSGRADAEVDAFLADLQQLELELVAADGSARFAEAVSAFTLTRHQLETLMARDETSQRDALCDVFDRLPEIRQAPDALRQILATGTQPADVLGRGADLIDPLCLPTTAYLSVFGGFQVLKVVATVAQTICDASECPVYAGVIVCAPVPPACALACPVAGIAESLALVAEAFLTGDGYCGDAASQVLLDTFIADTGTTLDAIDTRLGTLAGRLDTPLSSRASADSVANLSLDSSAAFGNLEVELIDTAAALTDFDQQLRDFAALEQRLRIEELLADPDDGPVGSLLRTAQQGGELERVREVVARAIQRTLASGEAVGDAALYFSHGDTWLNSGETLAAYTNYRRAYQEAAAETIRPDGANAPPVDITVLGGAS